MSLNKLKSSLENAILEAENGNLELSANFIDTAIEAVKSLELNPEQKAEVIELLEKIPGLEKQKKEILNFINSEENTLDQKPNVPEILKYHEVQLEKNKNLNQLKAYNPENASESETANFKDIARNLLEQDPILQLQEKAKIGDFVFLTVIDQMKALNDIYIGSQQETDVFVDRLNAGYSQCFETIEEYLTDGVNAERIKQKIALDPDYNFGDEIIAIINRIDFSKLNEKSIDVATEKPKSSDQKLGGIRKEQKYLLKAQTGQIVGGRQNLDKIVDAVHLEFGKLVNKDLLPVLQKREAEANIDPEKLAKVKAYRKRLETGEDNGFRSLIGSAEIIGTDYDEIQDTLRQSTFEARLKGANRSEEAGLKSNYENFKIIDNSFEGKLIQEKKNFEYIQTEKNRRLENLEKILGQNKITIKGLTYDIKISLDDMRNNPATKHIAFAAEIDTQDLNPEIQAHYRQFKFLNEELVGMVRKNEIKASDLDGLDQASAEAVMKNLREFMAFTNTADYFSPQTYKDRKAAIKINEKKRELLTKIKDSNSKLSTEEVEAIKALATSDLKDTVVGNDELEKKPETLKSAFARIESAADFNAEIATMTKKQIIFIDVFGMGQMNDVNYQLFQHMCSKFGSAVTKEIMGNPGDAITEKMINNRLEAVTLIAKELLLQKGLEENIENIAWAKSKVKVMLGGDEVQIVVNLDETPGHKNGSAAMISDKTLGSIGKKLGVRVSTSFAKLDRSGIKTDTNKGALEAIALDKKYLAGVDKAASQKKNTEKLYFQTQKALEQNEKILDQILDKSKFNSLVDKFATTFLEPQNISNFSEKHYVPPTSRIKDFISFMNVEEAVMHFSVSEKTGAGGQDENERLDFEIFTIRPQGLAEVNVPDYNKFLEETLNLLKV